MVARGDLTEKHRNALLVEMTDSVADLVLRNNYRQVQAISMAQFQAVQRGGEYQRFIRSFEEAGRLNRDLQITGPGADAAGALGVDFLQQGCAERAADRL